MPAVWLSEDGARPATRRWKKIVGQQRSAYHSAMEAADARVEMRHCLTALLIPAILVAQGVGIAHSHAATGVAEPDGHAVRPHIHLCGGCSHSHGPGESHSRHHDHGTDQEDAPAGESPSDGNHDDDAVYGSKILSSRSRAAAAPDSPLDLAAPVIVSAVLSVAAPPLHAVSRGGLPPPFLDGDAPIHLQKMVFLC